MKNSHKIPTKTPQIILKKAYYSIYYFISLNVIQYFLGGTLRGPSKEQGYAVLAHLTRETDCFQW